MRTRKLWDGSYLALAGRDGWQRIQEFRPEPAPRPRAAIKSERESFGEIVYFRAGWLLRIMREKCANILPGIGEIAPKEDDSDRHTCAENNLQSHDCHFLPKLIVTFRRWSSGAFSLIVRYSLAAFLID